MCDYCWHDATYEWVKNDQSVKTCEMSICHDAVKYALGDDAEMLDLF